MKIIMCLLVVVAVVAAANYGCGEVNMQQKKTLNNDKNESIHYTIHI